MTNLIRIIAILLLFTACDDAGFFTSETENLRLELEIISEEINTLRDIEAELTVTNISDGELVLEFSSSCQHGYIIKGDSVIFDSREETGCAAVLTELKLEPQDSENYSISLSSAENDATLEKGTYTLEAFLLNDQSPVTVADFTVE